MWSALWGLWTRAGGCLARTKWAVPALVGGAACGEMGGPMVPGADAPFAMTAITTGAWHSCAIAARGSGAGPELVVPQGPAFCWGHNDEGQVGAGEAVPSIVITQPVAVAAGLHFFRLAAGRSHTCGIAADSTVYCWGGGIVGRGARAPERLSAELRLVAIVSGDAHVCALTSGGALYCWGANARGQLGDGTVEERPQAVRLEGGPFITVAAGARHTCAAAANGATWCWGDNATGQLGTGAAGGAVLTPAPVAARVRFTALAAGGAHSCGLRSEVRTGGKPAYCWGDNATGQVGVLAAETVLALPVEVSPTLAFRAIAAGAAHTCGIVHDLAFAEGQAGNNLGYCWGGNARGQLGTGAGAPIRQAVPDSVHFASELMGIAAGAAHTCAVSGHVAYCWGDNTFGQLGTGSTASSPVPTLVRAPR